MGDGIKLKEYLDAKGANVRRIAKATGISATTLYSIIQRDTAIRFDTALRIANILDVPVDSLCKDNPYDGTETLPVLRESKKDSDKITYMSARTAKILNKFDFTELPMVDQLIADLYVLDDSARRDLFEYVKMVKKLHSSPEREKELRNIK